MAAVACLTQAESLLIEGPGEKGGHYRGRKKERGSSSVPAYVRPAVAVAWSLGHEQRYLDHEPCCIATEFHCCKC